MTDKRRSTSPPSAPAEPEPPQARPGPAGPGYLDMPLGEFLAALSAGPSPADSRDPPPGDSPPGPAGGSVAALTVTLAAGLCVMAAHRSVRQLPQAAQLAAQAQGLRDRAAPLAQADAEGYRAVLAARRARDPAVAAALAEASEVPMQVARIGARVAGLARQIAAGGNPAVHGDAVAAALLAAAAARTSAVLVRANLAEPADTRPADTRRADTRRADAGPADARIARAQQDADEATAQAREAEGRPRDGKETVRGPE